MRLLSKNASGLKTRKNLPNGNRKTFSNQPRNRNNTYFPINFVNKSIIDPARNTYITFMSISGKKIYTALKHFSNQVNLGPTARYYIKGREVKRNNFLKVVPRKYGYWGGGRTGLF
jgi:hypothetical protein